MSILKVPNIFRIVETDDGFFIERRVRVIYWFWEAWTNPKYEWVQVDMYGYGMHRGNSPSAPSAKFDTLEKARDQIRKWEKPTYKIHEP